MTTATIATASATSAVPYNRDRKVCRLCNGAINRGDMVKGYHMEGPKMSWVEWAHADCVDRQAQGLPTLPPQQSAAPKIETIAPVVEPAPAPAPLTITGRVHAQLA